MQVSILRPTSLIMALFLLKLSSYSLLALASATFLAVLKRRLRQRGLCKIPGPTNTSFFWGKIHWLERALNAEKDEKGHWRHMFNLHAYVFYEELYRTYGKVARVSGFLGVGSISRDFRPL
jgi:hypothetical protein